MAPEPKPAHPRIAMPKVEFTWGLDIARGRDEGRDPSRFNPSGRFERVDSRGFDIGSAGQGNPVFNPTFDRINGVFDPNCTTPIVMNRQGEWVDMSVEQLTADYFSNGAQVQVILGQSTTYQMITMNDTGRLVRTPVNKVVYDAWSDYQMKAAEKFLFDPEATLVMPREQWNPLLTSTTGAENVFLLTNVKQTSPQASPISRLIEAAKRDLGAIRLFDADPQALAGLHLDLSPQIDSVRLASGDLVLTTPGVARFVDMETAKQQAITTDNLNKTKDEWIAKRTAAIVAQGGRGNVFSLDASARFQAELEWDNRMKGIIQDLPVVVDTSIPGAPSYMRVVDHHGPFLKKGDGRLQKANATMQMVNNFEAALRRAGVTDIQHPTDAQVDDAIRLMNIKQVTTDNLADGAWSVWMARHQAEVLKNPDLRKLIRQATYFEDFTAFGNNYDRNDPAVQLQAALFSEYGRILKENQCFAADRFPPEKAEKVMSEALAAIDKMLGDPSARAATADAFWHNVDAARAKAAGAVLYEAKVNGKTAMKFYDMSKLKEFTVFEKWLAIPDINRERPLESPDGSLQLDGDGFPMMGPGERIAVMPTVAPMPSRPEDKGHSRTMTIVPIQNGMRLAKAEGLLTVLDVLNQAEKAKAEALGVPVNTWFGKDSVVLPNPMGGGTLLTPKEIADIVTDTKYGLFQ